MAEQQPQQQHATSSSAATPLLGEDASQSHLATASPPDRDDDVLYSPPFEDDGSVTGNRLWRLRSKCARALASRRKHFVVMAVVALDVTTLLANIFLQLIACETDQADEPWVRAASAMLELAGLVFSSAFMVELAACLFAFGWSYLNSKFHLFDAVVIVLSFLIDVTMRGPAESIGSLLVVLRLWRLAKISEEVVLGATERMEMLEHHIDDLEHENRHLRTLIKSQNQGRDPRRQSAIT